MYKYFASFCSPTHFNSAIESFHCYWKWNWEAYEWIDWDSDFSLAHNSALRSKKMLWKKISHNISTFDCSLSSMWKRYHHHFLFSFSSSSSSLEKTFKKQTQIETIINFTLFLNIIFQYLIHYISTDSRISFDLALPRFQPTSLLKCLRVCEHLQWDSKKETKRWNFRVLK
jgi:hypothetical protein